MSTTQPRRGLPNLVWLLLLLALAIGLLLWFTEVEPGELLDALAGVRPEWVFLGLLATLLHYLLEPARWRLYLHGKKAEYPQLYRRLLSIYSITALISYLVPAKLGLPLRIALLRTNMGVPVILSTTLLAVDGIMAYSIWGLFALWSYVFLYDGLNWLLLAAAIGLLLVLLFARRLHPRLLRLAERLHEGLGVLKPRLLASAAGIDVTDVLSHTLRHAALVHATGTELDFLTLLAIATLSVFAGLISMLPMGLGAYDASVVFLLQQAGMPLEAAVLVPILNRLLDVFTSVLLAVPSGYHLGVSPWAVDKMRGLGASQDTPSDKA